MKIHPFANLFPMQSVEEIQALADDIAKHGLRQPIVSDIDDQIIDGRNRAAACLIAGVTPIYEPFVGTEAELLAYVVSVNIHRRHLTTKQRADIAAKIVTMKVGENQHSKKKKEGPSNDGGSPKVSAKAAAKMMNVGVSSVERAKTAAKPAKPKPAEPKPAKPKPAESKALQTKSDNGASAIRLRDISTKIAEWHEIKRHDLIATVTKYAFAALDAKQHAEVLENCIGSLSQRDLNAVGRFLIERLKEMSHPGA